MPEGRRYPRRRATSVYVVRSSRGSRRGRVKRHEPKGTSCTRVYRPTRSASAKDREVTDLARATSPRSVSPRNDADRPVNECHGLFDRQQTGSRRMGECALLGHAGTAEGAALSWMFAASVDREQRDHIGLVNSSGCDERRPMPWAPANRPEHRTCKFIFAASRRVRYRRTRAFSEMRR